MTAVSVRQPPRGASIVAESEWPPQGEWTHEDYRRLPEGGWIYEVSELEAYKCRNTN